jgi:hypothetical protein
MKTHKGSCHCGAVLYEVTAEFTESMRCNCSHCKRKGWLLAFVPVDSFSLISGADAQTTYHFNKHHIDHTFCKTCGVQSFAYGGDGNGNYMYAINLNCLEDFDSYALPMKDIDGASL